MIVDFHTHIFPPSVKEHRAELLGADPLFAELYARPSTAMATADEVLSSMERDGVDLSVVLNIGWSSQRLCEQTNDYILEAVARYPERLVGFCAIQPREAELAVREVERCARAGARGIGELRPDVQGCDLTDPQYMAPVVEALTEFGLILLLHTSEPVGHPYPGKGSLTPEVVYRFIARFPQLKLVCAHWGGGLPFYALMPEVADALNNTYFDTAASPFLYRPAIFTLVSKIIGEEKILLGSDFPLMPQARPIREVRSLPLPQPSLELMLGGNALRLLGRSG